MSGRRMCSPNVTHSQSEEKRGRRNFSISWILVFLFRICIVVCYKGNFLCELKGDFLIK